MSDQINLDILKRVELLALCKTFGLSGYSKKTKPLLILAIESHLQKKSVDSYKSDQSKKFKLSPSKSKGAKCSVKGKEYELKIHDIVKRCEINGVDFNTQTPSKLGGTGPANDIECNLREEGDIAIEIKKCKAPDWMQCSLIFDKGLQRWIVNPKGKIPVKSKALFEELIAGVELFNGNIPPCLDQKMTHDEWVITKSKTTDFSDMYIDCPSDTILRLYKEKFCSYIQISDKGLYHLGDDICNFGVPVFICEQRLRVRVKIHKTKNKEGFCDISVIVACQPKNITKLVKSPHSLDDVKCLPKSLTYT